MTRRISAFVFSFLLGALLVWASDPWKDKTPEQWTAKEADRILRDSPWTKIIAVPTIWARTGGEKFGVGAPTVVTIDRGGTRVGTRPSDDPRDPQNQQGYFLLRWASSRTVQAVEARLAALKGKKPAKSDLPADEATYRLELVWDLFVRFPVAKEEDAAANSYLLPSRLGVEFQPKRVEYRHGPAGAVTSVVFIFAKKTPTGKDLIAAGENRVEFGWRMGPTLLRAHFDPGKMVARDGQDY